MSGAAGLQLGEVVLVTFPFTDLSSLKVRPALVVGRVVDDDLLVAFISSRTAGADARVDCLLSTDDPEFPLTGLRTASLVRLNKLATLHRGLVRRRLGRIGPETRRVIAQRLRYVFELD